jgi:two-component system, NarL family, invasion response regulator UvrY
MERKNFKVALVDDMELVREGIGRILDDFKHIKVISKTENGQEFINSLHTGLVPDVVFLDADMPVMNGEETAEYLHVHFPEIKIIILSRFSEYGVVYGFLIRGVKGYLHKDASQEELSLAIENVMTVGYHFNEFITSQEVEKLIKGHYITPDKKDAILTFSEKELAKFFYQGLKRNQAMEVLGYSVKTYDSNRLALFEKTKASSEAMVISFCIKHNLLTEEFLKTPILKKDKK